MRPITIAILFAWTLLLLAALMLLPWAVAVSFEEVRAGRAFGFGMIVSTFVGGGILLALRGAPDPNLRQSGLLFLGVLWLVLPIWAAIPFLASGAMPEFHLAYFEAVSGLTTTGATILEHLADVPKSVIMWRAALQWIGGLITLISIVAIIGPAIGGISSVALGQRVAATRRYSHWLPRPVFEVIIPVYSAMTLASFIGLIASGLPLFDALCLAMSAVSTGGFMPRDGTIALYGSYLAPFILSLTMLAGAINLFWLRGLLLMRRDTLARLHEPVWVLLAIVVLGFYMAYGLAGPFDNGPVAEILSAVIHGFSGATSLISTTGFQMHADTLGVVPYVLIVAICLVGAGQVSTSGGLKFFRVGMMLRLCGRELHHLVYPHSALASNSQTIDKQVGIASESAICATFIFVIVSIVFLTLVLSGYGLDLPAALLASLAAISNVGPVFEAGGIEIIANAPGYADLPAEAHVALAIGMILGRLELLAALSIINLAPWHS